MAAIKLLMGNKEKLNDVAVVAGQLLFTIDEKHAYLDTAAGDRVALYKDALDDIDTLQTLVGSKSVATQISEAIQALTGSAPGTGGDGEGDTPQLLLVTEVKAGNGISVDSTDGSKPIVAVKVRATDNILKVDTDGSLYVDKADAKDYSIEIEEVTEGLADGVAKAYKITQDAAGLEKVINIPADMVVSSGSVVTYAAEDSLPEGVAAAGTYLVLTLANATKDKIYINVGDLIEYVTSGSEANDDIVVVVSSDHKVTATLSAAIKAQLAKADTAVQPADLATEVTAKTYISGFTVDEDSGKIKVQTATIPEMEWGSF